MCLALQLIDWDLSTYYTSLDARLPTPPSEGDVDGFHDRLKQWASQLPECLSSNSCAPPAIIDLHVRYPITIHSVFGRGGITQRPNAFKFAHTGSGKETCRSSARGIRRLLNSYHSRWPIDSLPVAYIHSITVALLTLLDLIPEARFVRGSGDGASCTRAQVAHGQGESSTYPGLR
ncbi:hypothetical protein BJX64DRAFT_284456 [Aspergillus heterothallicus]